MAAEPLSAKLAFLLGAFRQVAGGLSNNRKLRRASLEVLYKGMSSEKHFSPLERQKCFPDIQPLP